MATPARPRRRTIFGHGLPCITAAILQDGRREGYWGLGGKRERADRVGGRLKISNP